MERRLHQRVAHCGRRVLVFVVRVEVEEGGVVFDAVVPGEIPEGEFAELAEDKPAAESEEEGEESGEVVAFSECPEDRERADLLAMSGSCLGRQCPFVA